MAVGLVEQPYRVAGRPGAAPAAAAGHRLRRRCRSCPKSACPRDSRLCPLIVGGRSSGARVACRTGPPSGAAGVLALAFPLQPPQRRSGHEPPSRLPELLGAGVPVLVVQGERDPFGSDAVGCARQLAGQGPNRRDGRSSTAAGADHALRKGIDPY